MKPSYVALKNQIVELLMRANGHICILDEDNDLFSASTNVQPRDLLFVCMELKQEYSIDYNLMVDQVETYTLRNFTEAILSQL